MTTSPVYDIIIIISANRGKNGFSARLYGGIMKKQKYTAFGNVAYIIKDIYKNNTGLFVFLVLSALCQSAQALIAVCLPKAAVDTASAGTSPGEAAAVIGGFTLALMLVNALASLAGERIDGAYYDLRMLYLRRIVVKSMRQSYSRLESEEGQTCYWKARDVALSGSLCGVLNNTLTGVVGLLNFTTFSAIIARLNPLIMLLLAAQSAVTFVFMKRGSRIWEAVRADRAKANKQKFVLAEAGADPKNGKDVRLYGMRELFVGKLRSLAYWSMKMYSKQRSGYVQQHLVDMAMYFIRDAAAYAYLIYRAADGSVAAGDFVLYFGAITAFSGWTDSIIWRIDVLRRNFFDVSYFRDFMEYEDPAIENPEHISEDCPTIEFKNVSFSYDGKTDVLKDFNLTVSPGEHIALIGRNGAGKSTAVKLLCGFYAPTAGSVKIGGAEASRVPEEERFAKISAVFQDLCILPHTVAENVSMRSEGETDMEKAADSLEKAGIGRLKAELSRPMTRAVRDDGIELSGGEGQKLMMARAIYKDAPILILDEPTAALDPIAESETYQSFHELSAGKTAVYISHRLAGTRFCDRIVFLKDGSAAEIGTHEELMALDGGYAEMFRLQSHYYNEGAKGGDEA